MNVAQRVGPGVYFGPLGAVPRGALEGGEDDAADIIRHDIAVELALGA